MITPARTPITIRAVDAVPMPPRGIEENKGKFLHFMYFRPKLQPKKIKISRQYIGQYVV